MAAAQSVPGVGFINLFGYLPAYYKEEGDLAAIVGDTAAAIRAYNKYLTLRSDPDSGAVQAEVDSVRAAYEELVRRWGGR